MSNFYEIFLLLALAGAFIWFWFFIHGLTHGYAHAIVTGVDRGVAIPAESRQLRLATSWYAAILVGVAWEGLQAFGWLLLAQNAGTMGSRLFGYICAVYAVGGLLSFVASGAFWLPPIRRALRQAEAD
jgi:hypothetical protein